MKINVDVEYKPSPEELAEWIWDLSDEEQAKLLDNLGWIDSRDKILTQLVSVCDCIDCNKHSDAIWFIEKLYEYCEAY